MPHRRDVRVALLSTVMLDLVAELLPVAARPHRLGLTPILAPFGRLEAELLDPDRRARVGDADYTVLAGTWHDVLEAPGRHSAGELENRAFDRWSSLVRMVHEHTTARPVLLGFGTPPADPYGQQALVDPEAPSATIRRLNARLAAACADNALFVDVERLASRSGLDTWEDTRFWHQIRQPFAADALPQLAAAIADTIAADCGLTRRCVVVDLDNTLWPGVVGDDGIAAVALDTGATGEAHAALQRHLLALRQRGIVLAVASKNDHKLAVRALDEVPGMLLRASDFAWIEAGWQPKPEQLRAIADGLRLGLESMVFVDDNPAERAEVAAALPEVHVVNLPRHPSGYAAALAATRGLAAHRAGTAGTTRATSYAAVAAADALSPTFATHEAFLDSLHMRASVDRVKVASLTRAAELVVKTNQFNLTTRRRTAAQLLPLIDDPDWYTATLTLTDRLASHGVVGLLLAHADADTATVDTLLLSCRVIGRTAETTLLASAVRWARQRGCRELRGLYQPTARNSVTADVYDRHGFTPTPDSGDGIRTYRFDLSRGPFHGSPHITERDHHDRHERDQYLRAAVHGVHARHGG
ncbi:methoxymalonyl-ACP biosynthesis protein FkbH [Catellatospora methionotrophica]|uniref:Methoxymalonyl-ACP biosynthesis protein FkbH n=1 Tax=Catellatospora methionotrophica TaxID=121620 RepID=A0A8J3PGQ7_9ACTN|nr:HAD-IIIC family phosphatase [Catellatospora methionotrophica]GIG14561.1 methoxymalonyl-ACP biosynthesis protein FkbH [Catellatospora methionotrophica]